LNPLRLHVRNYRCFEQLDLQLPDGCVAILGHNGEGKSSIAEAIEVALFGECRTGRLPAQHARAAGPADDLVVELDLDHAGHLYRIRRTYSARGRGKTTLDLERAMFSTREGFTDDAWTPLTCGSAKETQELIEQTLGLNRETFRASAFLAQGDGAAFTDAAPRDRKRILANVLGLDRYDRLQERARQDKRAVEADLQTLDGRTQAARELAAQKPAAAAERDLVVAAETELVDTIADREREHEQLSARYQEAREQGARRAAAEAELREATTKVAQLTQRTLAADDAARAIVAASLELDTLPAAADTAALEQRETEAAAAVEEHTRARRERDELLREHDRLTKERDQLAAQCKQSDLAVETVRAKIAATEATPDATCETCGQHVAGDAKLKTLATYQAELDTLLAKQLELYEQARAVVLPHVPAGLPPAPTAALDQVRAELRVIRESATRRAQLEERIRQLEPAAASGPLPDEMTAALVAVTDKTAALERLEPVDLDEITRQGTLVKERLTVARAQLEQQRTVRARLDERLAQIVAAERQVADAAAEHADLQQRLDVFVALERAFGRDGIPALIVESSAIPYLETEANRILDALGTSFRVELRTQAELKTSDGLRETLDVVVDTDTGEGAYETFSGGERTRLNLALRIALARLLANRRGAESRLLSIDEPDGLDDHGMAALVDVLRGLEGDFSKLYVVSHVPALRDSFDTTLQVVRDGAWSRVNETGVFETVAA
jgi:exonuclease SbcC